VLLTSFYFFYFFYFIFLFASSPIDRVLERGEKIELLVDKSDQLDQHAFKFKSHSRSLKRAMWWKNAKLIILISLIVIVSLPPFLLLLFLSVVSFYNCYYDATL